MHVLTLNNEYNDVESQERHKEPKVASHALQLHLYLLGPPEVRVGAKLLTFPTRKTLALLIYLALEGGEQPREHLAALLWPESSPARSHASLRNTLGHLQSALRRASRQAQTSFLSVTHNALALNPDAHIHLDLHTVERAYALARARSRAVRSTLLTLTLLPFFTGAVVRAYSWILMLGNEGFLNGMLLKLGIISTPYQLLFTQRGVVVGLVHFSMPVMILILAAALSHLDPNYERGAQSLGAGPVRTFLSVTVPLSMPGIISGSLVIFAWTFSAFPTPALVGGGRVKMIANVVEDLALEAFNWPGGAAFAMVSLVGTLVLIYMVQHAMPEPAGGDRDLA